MGDSLKENLKDGVWVPTRPYLESLTTFDLIKMADNAGIDIPPGLDRIFIIEEILDFYLMEEEEILPEPEMIDTVLVESVHLPKQYNITFVEVIVRDPLWVFVFWEVKSQDKEQYEKSEKFEGYYLKVTPLPSSIRSSLALPIQEPGEGVFTVPVDVTDNAWYLGFNSEIPVKDPYKVELCAAIDGEEIMLAVSRPFVLPALPGLPAHNDKNENNGVPDNPLLLLSGLCDFPVLRRNERNFRQKRSSSRFE